MSPDALEEWLAKDYTISEGEGEPAPSIPSEGQESAGPEAAGPVDAMFQKASQAAQWAVGPKPAELAYDFVTKEDVAFLQKPVPLLNRVFSLYQRGQYGLAGGALELAKGGDPIEGAYKGFVEGVPASWIDVMNTVYPDPAFKVPNFALGMGMDFALDPMTYATPGVMRKAYDLLGMGRAFQALENMPVIEPSVQKMRKWFQEFGEVKRWPGAQEAFKGHKLMTESDTRAVLNEIGERKEMFVELADELGFKDPEKLLGRVFTHYQEGKEYLIPWKLKPHLQKDIDWLDDLFAKDVQAGILDPSDYVTNYLPHILKDKETGKYFGATMSYKNPNSLFYTKTKKYDTADELQAAVDSWGAKGHLPVEKDYEVVKDWYEAVGVRAWLGDMAREQGRFTDELLGRFSIPVADIAQLIAHQKGQGVLDPGFDLARKGWVAVASSAGMRKTIGNSLHKKLLGEALGEDVTLSLLETLEQRGGTHLLPLGSGGGVNPKLTPLTIDEQVVKLLGKDARIMPRDVYDMYKKSNSFYISDEYISGALTALRSGMTAWTTMATSLRLPFHMRNVTGNQVALMMAGMNPLDIVRYNGRAAQLQFGRGEFYGMNAKEFMSFADKVGARGYGFQGADIPSRFSTELQKRLDLRTLPEKMQEWGSGLDSLIKEPTKLLAAKARAFGAVLEDNSRLSLFMHEMDKLGAKDLVGQTSRLEERAKIAMEIVNKHLHDYSSLSRLERIVAKNIWPFYTFMRKNIVRHIEALVGNPAYYARLAKYREDLYPLVFGKEQETEAEKYVKTQLDDQMRLHKSRWRDSAGNPVHVYVDLPHEQLRMLEQPMEFLRSTNPILGLGAVLLNARFWPKPGPIDDGRRMPAPFWINWLGKPEDGEKWHSLMNYGPMIDPRTKKVVMGMSPQWKEGLEQAFPFMREWSGMLPQENSVVVEDQGKWKAINYLTGLRFAPLDMEKGMLMRRMQFGAGRSPKPGSYRGEMKRRARSLGRELTEEEELKVKREVFR